MFYKVVFYKGYGPVLDPLLQASSLATATQGSSGLVNITAHHALHYMQKPLVHRLHCDLVDLYDVFTLWLLLHCFFFHGCN